MPRSEDISEFYCLISQLSKKLDGARKLACCKGAMAWPRRGVYFFMEAGEVREESGAGMRIVRIGTHAIRPLAETTLWQRLSQHRGNAKGGGNHRASVFRKIVGNALIKRHQLQCPTWQDAGNPIDAGDRDAEIEVEKEVSKIIGQMPFVWVTINDEPNNDSLRAYIERNSIALLSNYRKEPIDKASQQWLGSNCTTESVKESGLWNSNHVNKKYDPDFLKCLKAIIEKEKDFTCLS